jgi:nucleoside-diphosphate-sugar epimerase
MWANVFGVHELLEYARRGGAKKVVYISSSEVYGKVQSRANGYVESDYGFVDILSPRASYPMGKRAAEALCACYTAEYEVNASIVRPGHIYGPTCSPEDRRVSSAFAWQAARGEELVLKSAGTSVRSYTHATDCARGILTVCERGLRGEAYNIASRKGTCSIRRMAEIMAQAGGVNLRMELPGDYERQAFNPMDNSCLDPTKLEQLGWRDEITPEEGFTETVNALREKLKGTCHA